MHDLPAREGMEGWVDLDIIYIPKCQQTVVHSIINHLVATRLGVEPSASRSQVQRPIRYTIIPSYDLYGLRDAKDALKFSVSATAAVNYARLTDV